MSRESKLKGQEDPEPTTICNCLNRIISSENYDEVGEDIARIMRPSNKEQLYDQWVETWLIKCIKECFRSDPVKMDIMFARFALLPNFTLHMPIKDRLMRYVEISGYLVRYPTDSKRSFDEIKNDPDDKHRKEELKSIENKIARMQRGLVDKLVQYIEELPLPAEHITNLQEYGTLKSINGKKVYYPFPIKLNVPRLDTLPSIDSVYGTMSEEHSQESSVVSMEYSKEEVPSPSAEDTAKLDSGDVVLGPKKMQATNHNDNPNKESGEPPSEDPPRSNDIPENKIPPNEYTGKDSGESTSTGGNDKVCASPKQWMDFVLKMFRIVAITFVAIYLILALGQGKMVIPTPMGDAIFDFTRQDYISEKQLKSEVAESAQEPSIILVQPTPPGIDDSKTANSSTNMD